MAKLTPANMIRHAEGHPIKVQHADTPGLFHAITVGDCVAAVRLVVLQRTYVNHCVAFTAMGDDNVADEDEGSQGGLFTYRVVGDCCDAEVSAAAAAGALVLSPLMAAVLSPEPRMVELLLLLGADPSPCIALPPAVGGGGGAVV